MNDLETKILFLGHRYKTFNPFTIAEKLNIDVQFRPFKSEPKGNMINFLGRPIILISDEIKYSNQRYFVCAHELGHALEHVEVQAFYIYSSKNKMGIEYEANNFAKKLLQNFYVEEYGNLPKTYDQLVTSLGFPENNKLY